MKTEIVKNSFTSGEISLDLFGRGDLVSYQNGAKTLSNVNTLRTGGVVRRSGTLYIKTISGKARTTSAMFDGISYLYIFTHKTVEILQGDTVLSTLTTPFERQDLDRLTFTTDKHSLLICSGVKPVQKIDRYTSGKTFLWKITVVTFKYFPEGIFSEVKGFPACAGFIQGRLVLAGTKTYPNRLWFSKSGVSDNFDIGTGLADESIDISLLSGEEERIVSMFSAVNLIVFTTTGEWIFEGSPITPKTIVARRQSRIGSDGSLTIPIVDAQGDIFFSPRSKRGLYSIQYNSYGNVYETESSVSMALHLVHDLVDMTYSLKHHRVFAVKKDGTMAVLTFDKVEGVMAWSSYKTEGKYRNVCVAGNTIYTIVERDFGTTLERFSQATHLDCSVMYEKDIAFSKLENLDIFTGHTISIVADGIVRSDRKVVKGIVHTISAKAFTVGKRYTHTIESLPFESVNTGKKMRLLKLTLRLKDTSSLHLDFGKGLRTLPFRTFGTGKLNTPVAKFTGDKTITTLGWSQTSFDSFWRIVGDVPLPVEILSITATISTKY